MAKDTAPQNIKYPGHDEGSNVGSVGTKPAGYSSPATFADLSQSPSNVNVKSNMGSTGKAE